MTPKEFVEIIKAQKKLIQAANETICNARSEAEECPPPRNRRPAGPNDIVVGAIIWHDNGDDGHFWNIVEEVLRPADPFKAYCADDGCRYGLSGAYVEVGPEDWSWPFKSAGGNPNV